MDRGGGIAAVDCTAMFPSGVVALELLLRADGSGECGEFEIDAEDRRALPGATVLRVTADDGMARGVGLSSEPQAGSTADAGDGIAGGVAGSSHECAPSGASSVSVLIAGFEDPRTERGVVFGYHVRAVTRGFSVLGGDHGLVQSVCVVVGVIEHNGDVVLRVGAGASVGDGATGDLQHGPGVAVYK